MYGAVSLNKNGHLNVRIMQYLKKHNIVYRSPQYRGCEGFPIGNGSFGGMLYHSADTIEMTLSHTDAIDFTKDGNFKAWAWESEEENTAPAACGRLSIFDGMPSFDKLYLKKYCSTLSLAEGSVQMESETCFSKYHMTMFCSREKQLLYCDVNVDTVEDVVKTVRLTRWGSRNFFHDYEQMAECREKNLQKTRTGTENGCLYVMQKLRGSITLTMVQVAGQGQVIVNNSHSIEYQVNPKCRHFTVFVRCQIIETEEEAASACLQFKEEAEGITAEKLMAVQRQEWKEFWIKSFVYLPDDDYIENLYNSYLYLLNSCSRGQYPVTFGGIWCPNADIRNWGHYYHWNHQQIYWGLHTGGHSELMENYYNYRENMLPQAQADGMVLFHSSGAFYSDISNYNGYQALEPDTVRNLTPGAQIAMDFYKHYQYTCDEVFLRQRAYPMMKACAKLYEDLLEDSDQGYMIRGGSSCYESYWILKATMTDWAMISVLFDALTEASVVLGCDEEKRKEWETIRSRLYSLPLSREDTGKGEATLLSPGLKWDNIPVRFGEGEYPFNTFGFSQLAAVYPSGVISLKDRGKKEFKAAEATFELAKERDFMVRNSEATAGHNAAPEIGARLGDKKDTMELIRMFALKYQVFKNGTCHFADIRSGKRHEVKYRTRVIESGMPTDWRKVHEKNDGKRVLLDTEVFLHCYFEAHANIYTGINEMLLQSCDGIIRVFPAAEQGMNAAFELYAAGGFRVVSEMVRGEILYVSVTASVQSDCRLENPWEQEEPIRIISQDCEIPFEEMEGVVKFHMEADEICVIERCNRPLCCYYQNEITGKENTGVKQFKGNQLGCDQEF